MTIHLSGATVGKSGSLQNSCQLEFDSLHRGVENFWKGSFAPAIQKRIVSTQYTDYGMNDEGEVWQLVDVTFGGISRSGKPWGTGTYTYVIRQPELDVDLERYGGDPDAARDDLGYIYYAEGGYREIVFPNEEVYGFQ